MPNVSVFALGRPVSPEGRPVGEIQECMLQPWNDLFAVKVENDKFIHVTGNGVVLELDLVALLNIALRPNKFPHGKAKQL